MDLRSALLSAYKKSNLKNENHSQNSAQKDTKNVLPKNFYGKEIKSAVFPKITSEKKIKKLQKENPKIKNPFAENPPKKSYIIEEKSKIQKKALENDALLKIQRDESQNSQITKEKSSSAFRRVAKFLILIGEERAAEVLKCLPQDQIEKIATELASVRGVSADEANEILQEFSDLVAQKKFDGGIFAAQAILQRAFGTEKAARIVKKVAPFANQKPFEYLKNASPKKIANLLASESVAVKATVLSFLDAQISALILNEFPLEEKKQIILRLAKIKKIDSEIVRLTDASIKEKFDSIGENEEGEFLNGQAALAAILKRMDKNSQDKIVENLQISDDAMAQELKKMLFTEEDFLLSDDRFLQAKLSKMEDEEIAILIAGKSFAFKMKILKNVSQFRAHQIEEESQIRAIKKSESERVTNDFYAFLRVANDEGRLIIKRSDEKYV